jgi:hypothetical protein
MAVDFPNAPKLNQRFDAPNGVTYTWDGIKWSLNVSSEDVVNYWTRNAVTEDLQPKSFNDTIVFSTLAVDKLEALP